MRKSIAGAVSLGMAVSARLRPADAEDGGPAPGHRTYQVGAFQQIECEDPMRSMCARAAIRAGGRAENLLEQVRSSKFVGTSSSIRPLERKLLRRRLVGKGKGAAGHRCRRSARRIAGSARASPGRQGGRPSFEGTVAGSGGISLAQIDVQQAQAGDRRIGRRAPAVGQGRMTAEYESPARATSISVR